MNKSSNNISNTVNVNQSKKRFKNIPRYIKNIPYRINNKRFKSYIASQVKKGRSFGTVDGTNETYLFDIKDTAISSKIFSSGKTYSEEEIRMFFYMTEKYYGFKPRKGDIFLDIGANIGTTSVYVAKYYKETLNVISFEPDPHNYKYLQLNIILNDCKNVTAENIGLSNKSEKKDMMVFQDNRGKNRMISPASGPLSQGEEAIKVQAICLDEYIVKNDIEKDKIKYIWIDTEGYEPYVVAGMSDLLSNGKIPLFMEFSYDIMSEDMFQLLNHVVCGTYQNYISISMQTGKEEKHKVDDLSTLYHNATEQYNLFFY